MKGEKNTLHVLRSYESCEVVKVIQNIIRNREIVAIILHGNICSMAFANMSNLFSSYFNCFMFVFIYAC